MEDPEEPPPEEPQEELQQKPPEIIEHPMNTTVVRSDPVTLNCQANGVPEPTITWFKAGVGELRPKPSSYYMKLPAGGLFFLRTVHGRKESDSGIYWCEASNALGKAVSRNATLTVACK